MDSNSKYWKIVAEDYRIESMHLAQELIDPERKYMHMAFYNKVE
jgi:hypothetical protein